MAVFQDRYQLALAAVGAGVLADGLYALLRPATGRARFYAFAAGLPMLAAGCLDGTVQVAPASQPAVGTVLPHPSAVTTVGFGNQSVPAKTRTPRSLRTESLLVTALALSIDNLAVGFALAVYPVDIWLAAITFGVVSILMSLAGLELGHRLGKRAEAWSEEIGGTVLILVGIAIAAGVLG